MRIKARHFNIHPVIHIYTFLLYNQKSKKLWEKKKTELLDFRVCAWCAVYVTIYGAPPAVTETNELTAVLYVCVFWRLLYFSNYELYKYIACSTLAFYCSVVFLSQSEKCIRQSGAHRWTAIYTTYLCVMAIGATMGIIVCKRACSVLIWL